MFRGILAGLILLGFIGTAAQAQQLLKAPIPSGRLIIFIHGILGTSKGTFTSVKDEKEVYWPQLVRDDEAFERADVYTYEYASSLDVDSAKIVDIVDKMAVDLEQKVNTKSYSSVLFVAHSMGGIIVRKYLLDQSRREDRGMLAKGRIKGIFLFGTPMDGSSVANVSSRFSNSRTLWQLRESNNPDSFLNTLRSEWIKAGLGTSVFSYCAYETAGVVNFIFWSKLVVEPGSAEPLCNKAFTGIPNRNHLDIVKPESADSYSHLLIRAWYQRIFGNEELGASDVVIASCDIDQFGKSHLEGFALQLFDLSTSHHVSLRLPKDWTRDSISLIWRGNEPILIALHYSCFQDGIGDRFIEEGRIDFNRFLADIASTNVKVLSYSRAFYPKFVDENITRANRKAMVDTGRLILMPLRYGKPVGPEQFKKFGDLVADVIGN